MKIIETRYNNGEAQFKIEERPNMTFCVQLKDMTTIEEVIIELKRIIPGEVIDTEIIFNNLALKTLEGTEI